MRGETPLNLEIPFEKLEGFLTPTESFYVRTHFPIPSIDRDAWWLRGCTSAISNTVSKARCVYSERKGCTSSKNESVRDIGAGRMDHILKIGLDTEP